MRPKRLSHNSLGKANVKVCYIVTEPSLHKATNRTFHLCTLEKDIFKIGFTDVN